MAGFDGQITFVFCADLARSARFYGEQLDLELVRNQGSCLIYRAADRAFVGVCEHREPQPGGAIITLLVDDVDGWARRLTEAGCEVDGPHVNARFAIYHCFVRDPDGYLVEIQRFDEPL